jgi:hypothetical protein
VSESGYIVFEQLEESQVTWTYAELQNFFFHWNEGFSLKYICSLLNRGWGEGALLVMSIAEQRSRIMLQRPKGIKVQSPLLLDTNYYSELTQFYQEVKKLGGVYTIFDYQEVNPKIDLFWQRSDLDKVIFSWRKGQSLLKISKKLKRKPLDVALLVVDLVAQGLLEARENGWEGNLDVIETSSRKAEQNKSDRTGRRSA